MDPLLAAVAAVALCTTLLPILGRRPTPDAARLLAFAPLTLIGVLPTEWTATLAVIAFLALAMPRRWYALGAVLFAALIVAFGLYAAYLVRVTVLLGGEPPSLALGLVLLALEVGAMGLMLGSAFEMIDALCAPRLDPGRPPEPERWPVVCLQVPAYNEPPELVIETVRSLVALDYPDLRIQVIDNNTTDEALWRPVGTECERLRTEGHRVDFVHLPEWPGYKAGALNWGRTHLADDVEIVGVVDADYMVDPAWLREVVPHLGDPSVAFVQTPQDYREWETSAFYRACYVGFAYFFAVGMVSRANRNAIIFAGTMGLIRRSVLDAAGGWDERIITEDAEISLRVLAQGHRAVYVPRAFGRGIMPLTYEGLRKQRFRWAFGGIQILRRHWRTLLGRRSGLTLGQRYDHLMGGLWWFNDALTLGFALFVGAAGLGAVAGHPFVVQRLTGIGLVLPFAFIGLNLVRYLWGLGTTTGVRPPLALAALRVNLSLSWVIALACARALSQDRGVFLRTPKFRGAPAIRELRLVWVETLLGGAAILLLVLVLLRAGYSTAGLTLAALLGWSALIYGSATGFALGDPTRAPLPEALREKALLELAPRVGRVARSRPARAGVVLLGALALVGGAVALEASRPPVAELPFQEVPAGPIARPPASSPVPSSGPSAIPGGSSSSASPSGPTPSPSPSAPGSRPPATPGPSQPSSAAPGTGSPGPSASPGATPVPTPAPTAAPSALPTPPTPVPTPAPSSRPSPSPHPTPTHSP